MTAFDHLRAGAEEAAWSAGGHLSGLARLRSPTPGSRVVVLAAHPDDETLGAGGLIAMCARRGVRVDVIVATDGEASHPNSPTTTPDRLARVRRAEVAAAVAELSPATQVTFLGLPDGRLAEHRAELATVVAGAVTGASHLVTPWRLDRHPDHEVCGQVGAELAGVRATRGAATHWEYPIWAWHWDDPASPELPLSRTYRLDLDEPAAGTKHRALQCHRSQHSSLSPAAGDEAILPPGILAHFLRGFETFVVDGAPPPSSPEFFEDLYSRADDPWDLQNRFYESRKRELLLAALPRARFGRAFEPGCSIGLLTEQLAGRCEQVLAWDVSARALEQARRHTAHLPNVVVERGEIPQAWPDGALDLIVLSEVGYYAVDLDRLATRIAQSLSRDGVLLACHWRHAAPDHPQTAQAVHDAVGSGLVQLVTHEERDFLLQVWSRSGRSVAEQEGIVG